MSRPNTSQALTPFVPGRGMIGDIDIGGLLRFGPQSSVNLRLVQNVYGVEDGLVLRARQTSVQDGLSGRALPGQHGKPDVRPGIYTFAILREFSSEPAGAIHRHLTPDRARSTATGDLHLFALYAQDDLRVHPRADAQRRPALRVLDHARRYLRARLGASSTSRPAPTTGQLYQNPTYKNLSPRFGVRVGRIRDGQDRTSFAAAMGCTSTPTTSRT